MEVSVSLIARPGEKPTGFRGIARDITDRKLAEDTLKASEEKYRLVVDNATEVIFIIQEGMLKFVNPGTVKLFGYPQEVLTSKPFTEFIHPDDRDLVMERHIKRVSGENVPPVYSFRIITADETIKWVEVHAVLIPWEGKPASLTFINDITERKQIEDERRQNVERLHQTLGATVQAMATTVEVRDPYTAGHQRRVTDLARSIASEMGLSDKQIDGIRMAALIHDIGKISVPAEILSKPTKLSAMEFNLVKVHPQAGYDILKNIEFPWPVARMVHEHHERIDGAGYPNGLKGDDTLLESRILSVADVVEAIASHRPYRPSLGLDYALAEIEKNKGTQFDPDVVDACLRLFNQKDYKITD